jgi:hypothetical protein
MKDQCGSCRWINRCRSEYAGIADSDTCRFKPSMFRLKKTHKRGRPKVI